MAESLADVWAGGAEEELGGEGGKLIFGAFGWLIGVVWRAIDFLDIVGVDVCHFNQNT